MHFHENIKTIFTRRNSEREREMKERETKEAFRRGTTTPDNVVRPEAPERRLEYETASCDDASRCLRLTAPWRRGSRHCLTRSSARAALCALTFVRASRISTRSRGGRQMARRDGRRVDHKSRLKQGVFEYMHVQKV